MLTLGAALAAGMPLPLWTTGVGKGGDMDSEIEPDLRRDPHCSDGHCDVVHGPSGARGRRNSQEQLWNGIS